MKKMFIAALAILGIASAVACSSGNQQETIFTGKITGLKSDYITFGGVLTPKMDTIAVNADGSFSAKFVLTEPKTDYILMENPKSGFKLYLEPGGKLDCQAVTYDTIMQGIDITSCRLTFTGDNADCNEFLNDANVDYYAVQNAVLEKVMAEKYSFTQFREALTAGIENVKKELEKLSNPRFIEANKADYDQKAENVLDFYGEIVPTQDEGYKAHLMSVDLNDPANLNKAGMYAKYYHKYEMPANKEDKDISFLRLLPQLFTNAKVISSIADQKIADIITSAPANLEEIFAIYKEVKGTEAIPEPIQKKFEQFNAMAAGKQATDFEMYDTEGKKVMLSDLKGKAVYMDCWATWCGPCKAEIPHMEKLYEHYKDNPNIVLVSVSIDKKTEPWLAMLKKDNPGWPQYIVKGEFKSQLCKIYGITGIPRFMMFDKEGKVISLNAPRPSSENITTFIDEALKK